MSQKKWPIATDEPSLQRRYQEYLERHDSYYPTRPRVSFEEFKVWDLKWAAEYETLWDNVNDYLDRHGLVLEFRDATRCDECLEQDPSVSYRDEYKKTLCDNCFHLSELRTADEWEPVPYPNADEIKENHRAW